MDSEVEPEGGAEQAFESLRTEIAAMRRSVEALPETLKKKVYSTISAALCLDVLIQILDRGLSRIDWPAA
jgi:hypothetical protein